ncbi:Uncharacterised protein [Legionella lansingensis]|uniref:Uncharacterized protein n=1 Tax=Legionella lansingensis TaxID=45067 RepID=A0A0W0VZ95_9GAMM|nr:hypothetical protein Llan_0182 [Legionella lansingensis]SNV51445.1 Uncharacterised protein [Legionella lansingensis]
MVILQSQKAGLIQVSIAIFNKELLLKVVGVGSAGALGNDRVSIPDYAALIRATLAKLNSPRILSRDFYS